jgi:HD-GYP domain-containing protein (c-di-GMP phosphodiesterase class II)
MQLTNQVFYLAAFVVMLGLMLGFFPQYEEYKVNRKTFFWPTGLTLYAISMVSFTVAPQFGKAALAVANISLIWGTFSIALLFRSWRTSLQTMTLVWAAIAMVVLALLYVVLLSAASTTNRIHYMNVVLAILCLWQIFELCKQLKSDAAFQIKALIGIEVLQVLTRVLRSTDLILEMHASPQTLYDENVFGFLLRISSILLLILMCILIAYYFLENIWRGHKRNSNHLEKGMLSSLNALSMARDNETGNHILRTQHYVAAIAKRLKIMGAYPEQLTPQFLDSIGKAAPLHDIGKVGIPDGILKKDGALTEEEWITMKTHAILGENVLTAAKREHPFHSEILDLAIDIAGGHHEHWDGSGYPRALVGEAIPLAARIMSLADMYDALVSERVYKLRWSHEEAVKEIVANKGKYFDPLVVEAFLAEQDYFKGISEVHED